MSGTRESSSSGLKDAIKSIASAGQSLPTDSSPLVQASIARDLDEASDDSSLTSTASIHDNDSDPQLTRSSTAPSAATTYFEAYRRQSLTTAGPRATFITRIPSPQDALSRERALKEEQGLLPDNYLISQHQRLKAPSQKSSLIGSQSILSPKVMGDRSQKLLRDEESGYSSDAPVSETTALLHGHSLPDGGGDDPSDISRKWEEAVAAGMIQTNWKRESKVIGGYAVPLVITFLLQYSLTVASIFTVGHM